MVPTGTLVPRRGYRPDSKMEFYRNRGDNGQVFLNRITNDIDNITTGRFCCEVPDTTGVNHTLCVLIGNLHVI